MSKSYDLSTSTKWANLADGEHVVKLRAKGAGYGSSSFSNSVTVTKGNAMPAKGDLITIESKQYRVLKTNGTVAEVLSMYDASSVDFDTDPNYNYTNTYANKNIDTYCNNTFYSGLSTTMKGAIVDKTFAQDSWKSADSYPTGEHYTGSKRDGRIYYLILSNKNYSENITRHCYCLSVQDVLDYVDATTNMNSSNTTLTATNIWLMFWNTATVQQHNIWLSSACISSGNSYAFRVTGDFGFLDYNIVSSNYFVRPAFQIDLSKIEWTPVGGGEG